MKEAQRRVILALKEAKEQKGLSNSDIVDLCDKQGDSVSPSSVRRVFAKGSEDTANFRTYILDAIFKAVIGTDAVALSDEEKAELTDTGKEIIAENDALKAMVDIKDKTIDDLQQTVIDKDGRILGLEQEIIILKVKLENTLNLFRIAMESLGKPHS